MPDTEKDKPKEKSTTAPITMYIVDNDEKMVITIDRKDPQRIQIMEAIGRILTEAKRDEDAGHARAFAQVAMPQPPPRPNPA